MPREKDEKGDREKALARVMRVLEGLWEALEIQGPPPLEVAEFLTQRGRPVVEVGPYYVKQAQVGMVKQAQVGMYMPFLVKTLYLPIPFSTLPRVWLKGGASGNVRVDLKDIFAQEGKVFFVGRNLQRVTENREAVSALRPLFAALGLGDLEEALEALSGLGKGEARMEGEYLLARERGEAGYFVLKRGSLLGDFTLDKAFLMGEDVALSFPGDVELVFRGRSSEMGLLHLVELEARWGEEKARLHSGARWVKARANGDDPVGELVRKMVARGLGKLDPPLPPRMRALLEALAKQKRPLQALKRKSFLRKVLLDALSRA
jgi:hypothetical protein